MRKACPSAALAVALLLALASACSGEPDAAEAGAAADGSADAPPPRGATLYAEWNCATCHGDSRQGTDFAPPLVHLTHWSERELVDFIEDPERFRGTKPELQAHGDKYPAPMPGFPSHEEDRRQLAHWLVTSPPPRSGTAR
jgi:mono/diheme cytochrome c family protein